MISYQTNMFKIKGKLFKRDDLKALEQFSLFTNQYGYIMTTKNNQFIVVNRLALSPYIYRKDGGRIEYRGYLQLRINTTNYFMYPDGSLALGVSNEMSHWPGSCFDDGFDVGISIVPGQTWDVIFNTSYVEPMPDAMKKNDYIFIYLRYIVYDDEDAFIADYLRENNIPVTPDNVCAHRAEYRELVEGLLE